jgi:hypothetical protein
MPRDAFNAVGGALEPLKPTLKFNDQDLYFDVDFPGYPSEVSGTSSAAGPGSGAMFRSLWDPIARMKDYEGRWASTSRSSCRSFPAGGLI